MRRGIFTLHCKGGLLSGTIEGEITVEDKEDVESIPARNRFAKMFLP